MPVTGRSGRPETGPHRVGYRSQMKCAGRELNPMANPRFRSDLRDSIPAGDSTAHYRSQMKCAGRELNPGYELGKLMSYHETTGACVMRA
jgi:hypothetical protein